MTTHAEFFQKPTVRTHVRYEALRAYYVDGLSAKEAAKQFGYTYGSFKNLCVAFRKNPTESFFWPEPKVARAARDKPQDQRPARIRALRKAHNASIYQIADLLKEEGLSASTGYIHNVLQSEAGYKKLPRRSANERSVRAIKAVRADRRAFSLAPNSFNTGFGGLFLFAFDLARIGMDKIFADMPGSALIPAGCAIRSLLALKLWGIGRPSQVMAETLDPGLALFTGLNVIPKRSTLTEYTGRCDPHFTDTLMHRWHHAMVGLDQSLGDGRSFDLDFHTIPYHGDEALLQKHFVSKRSRRQRGILTVLARDTNARIFAYADTTVRKETQNEAAMRFVEFWTARTGHRPKELVFDSGFTTYQQLAVLNDLDIDFITLRRRHPGLMEHIHAIPKSQWRKITLNNISRKYRQPRIVDEEAKLKAYPGTIRQILVKGLGHIKPTVLITNQKTISAAKLVDRYARRMVIENVISDAIDFFHMDALSAAVPMKINVDVQLTLIASMLYRMLGLRVGHGFEVAEARTLFRQLIPKHAKVTLTDNDITVSIPRRANNPHLMQASYHRMEQTIPWLGDKNLKIEFI